jgi:hypothetical protein
MRPTPPGFGPQQPIHQYPAYQVTGYGPPGQQAPSYPPYPPYPVSQAPPAESGFRKLFASRGAKAVAGGMATVVVTAFGIVGTYVMAPSQEVASQEAVEQHQRDQDAGTAPVSVEDVYGATTADGEANVISASVVEGLDGKTMTKTEGDPYGMARLLPDPYPMGSVVSDSSGELESGTKAPVQFTLTGQQNATVRIRDIRIVIKDKRPAFTGTMIFFPPQGNNPNLQMGFDLDSDDLSARVLDDREFPTEDHYFRENTVTLAKGEPIGFNTIVTTVDCACKFVFEVEFSDGRVVEVDDSGVPFMVAPYRDDAQVMYSPVLAPGTDEGLALQRCPTMKACREIAYK